MSFLKLLLDIIVKKLDGSENKRLIIGIIANFNHSSSL